MNYTNLDCSQLKDVLDCLFLSDGAKYLYTMLWFNSDTEEFSERVCILPQGQIALKAGISIDIIKKYLNELEEKGFVKVKIVRSMRSFIYEFCDISNNKYIIHSKIVQSLTPVSGRKCENFRKLLKEYLQSDLYKKVMSSSDVKAYELKIKDFFYQKLI